MGLRFCPLRRMLERLRVVLLAQTQFLLIIFFSDAFAQNERVSQGVFIVGEPTASTIRLVGAYRFVGKTPFTITQNLSGRYTLFASMRGYESKKMALLLGNETFRTISITLRPLSRTKAAFRSLLVPGWGQRYKGSKGRGLLFTGLALGAGVGTLMTHQNYTSAVDDAERARQHYEAVQHDFTEAQAALHAWHQEHRQADEAYDNRRRALVITAVVWSLNILDAMLMPPDPGGAPTPQVSLTNKLGCTDLRIGVQFSF